MDYVAPELQVLLKNAKTIAYHKDNLPRKLAIHVLKLTHHMVAQMLVAATEEEQVTLHQVCLGAWVFCLEVISAEYAVFDPNFKQGLFFNSGSQLYQQLLLALHITPQNVMSDEDRLIYLEKLYHFGFDIEAEHQFNATNLPTDLALKPYDVATVKSIYLKVIKQVLGRLAPSVTSLMRAVPPEKNIDMALMNFHLHYLAAKSQAKSKFMFSVAQQPCEQRLLYAQLGPALAALIAHMSFPPDKNSHGLTYVQRIKIGFFLFVMAMITEEYALRSPTNSALYQLCAQALNIKAINDMETRLQLDCLLAFNAILSHEKLASYLENYGVAQYGEANKLTQMPIKIHQITTQLKSLMTTVLAQNASINWPATRTLGELGALIFSAPGYGLGYVFGYSASESNHTLSTKVTLSDCVNMFGTAIVGRSGKHWGFLASDIIVQSVLTRAFAKVFESMGMLIGYATGGAVGLVCDLSYKGLHNLCDCYLYLYPQLNRPSCIAPKDLAFVQALLKLPPEAFSDTSKLKLEQLADITPQRSGVSTP